MECYQLQTKIFFHKRATPKLFKEGDLVLRWDVLKSRPGHHSKFDHMWSGPFMVSECKEHNAYQLSNLEGSVLPIPVNGIHLKHYFEV